MTTGLNQTSLAGLKDSFTNNQTAFNALVSAASRSQFLAGMLNAFYRPDASGLVIAKIIDGIPNHGTFAETTTKIVIDPNMLPPSGATLEQLDQFATLIAHELGQTRNGVRSCKATIL